MKGGYIYMSVSKAQQKAVNKYVKENYDRIETKVPKGQKAIIEAHAKKYDDSMNKFIVRAINETMKRDDDEHDYTSDCYYDGSDNLTEGIKMFASILEPVHIKTIAISKKM